MYYNSITYYQTMMDYCNTKAIEVSDANMKVFWHNAGIGFEKRMLECVISKR